jgi:putative pyruvate formate lyase activating enzyme
LQLLDGVVDIYMPDMKYAEEGAGHKYSRVREYPALNQAAVKEMHRQVGDLKVNALGIAERGLLVRHLVLPNGLAGTAGIAHFLATDVSEDTYINVMDQYRPCFRAREYSELDRRITPREYDEAVASVRDAGLWRLDDRWPRSTRVVRRY